MRGTYAIIFQRIIKREYQKCNLLLVLRFAFAGGESKRQDLEGRKTEWNGRCLVFLHDAQFRSYSLHAVTFFNRNHWHLYAQSEGQTNISLIYCDTVHQLDIRQGP